MLFLISSAILGHTQDDDKKSGAHKMFRAIVSLLFALFGIVMVVTAVLVASKCNPQKQFGYAIIAFLFPEIYLLQFGVRKYLLKQKGYCGGLPSTVGLGDFGSRMRRGATAVFPKTSRLQ